MTFKKITTGLIAALLLSGSVVSAQTTERAEPVAGAGPVAGGISTAWVVGLFAVFAAGLIIAIESGEDNDDLPVSP